MKLLWCVPLLFLVSFGYQNPSPITIETDKIKGIICEGTKQWQYRFKGKKLWMPTKEQVLDAEVEIERFLKDKPPAQSPNLWHKLPSYKRQYVGFIVKGHKRIFCNFYCTEERLDCNPVVYDDGGACFFRIEYDVEGQKVIKIDFNGEA
jgi:hypothetical protein